MPPTADQKLCFVVGPIGSVGTPIRTHADWLLDEIIEPVFSADFSHFRLERADKIASPGMIDSQIITSLLDAELVIADLSFLNANAFYEIGIRHMVQKPIIHMFVEGSEIPFDVKPYRAVPFKLEHPNDLRVARAELKKAIVEATREGFEVENPVTRARGMIRLAQHATPEQRLIVDRVEELDSRLRQVEMNSGVAALRAEPLGSSPVMAGSIAAVLDMREPFSEEEVNGFIGPILGLHGITQYSIKRIGEKKFGLTIHAQRHNMRRVLQAVKDLNTLPEILLIV